MTAKGNVEVPILAAKTVDVYTRFACSRANEEGYSTSNKMPFALFRMKCRENRRAIVVLIG